MNETRLYEIVTGYEDDPPVFVLAKNLRDALAKYKNDVVNIVNAQATEENALNTNAYKAPIDASDVEDPSSICMIGDAEQVIL